MRFWMCVGGAFTLKPSLRSCMLTLYRMGLASQHANVEIQLVCTDASRHFYTASGIEEAARAKGKSAKVWTDADEWSVRDGCSKCCHPEPADKDTHPSLRTEQSWKRVRDPILHIEVCLRLDQPKCRNAVSLRLDLRPRFCPPQLRRWADVILIAPLSANTLSKLSHGACDNLLTSLMRAIDPARTRVYVFPAMNTFMWSHPFTQPQLDTLKEIGYNVVGPVGKKLACGDVGGSV